jgi:hypothetical protein
VAQPNRARRVKPIPAFANREAEAHFWDTHDLTDYATFDARGTFGPLARRSEPVTLSVDPETLDLAKELAGEQDLPWQVLLEIWLIERRDAELAKRTTERGGRERESA